MQLLLIIIGGICSALFLYRSWHKNTEGIKLSDGTSEAPDALNGMIEMQEYFFSEIQKGKKAVKFMHLFYQQDIMVIQSIFQSNGIPYKIENNHLPSVLTGYCVYGFNHADFYILRENYDEALNIVKEYAERKKSFENSKNPAKKIGDLITIITAAGYIPDKDETSGIVIFKPED